MNLESNVKIKTKFWNLIPWISIHTATALYPNIYLPKIIYKNLSTPKPDPYNIAVLIHEQTHIKRFEKVGVVKFILKYIFDKNFRFQEELIATKEAMKFIKSRRLTWDINHSAHSLSSWLYLWPKSYDQAQTKLKNIWEKI